MQARRDRQGWRGNGGDGISRVALTFRLQHSLRHFLNEQRDAVGTLDYVLPNSVRQLFVASDAVDHCPDFALAEAIEIECSDVGSANPRCLEIRSMRDNQ